MFAHGHLMYLRALINVLVDLDPGVEFFSIAISYQQLLLLVIHVQIHAFSPIKNSGIKLPVDVAQNITNLPMEGLRYPGSGLRVIYTYPYP